MWSRLKQGLVLLCIVPFSLAPFSLANLRAQSLRRDIKMYEGLTISTIRSISSSVDDDAQDVANELTKRLSEIYLKDPSEKSIAKNLRLYTESSFERYNEKESNENIQRLFTKKFLSTPQRNPMIIEAPNMFLAHYKLADAYQKLKKPYKAAFHLSMASRYRSMKMSLEVFKSKSRLALDDETNRAQVFSYDGLEKKIRKSDANLKLYQEDTIIYKDNLIQLKKDSAQKSREQKESNRGLLKTERRRQREALQKKLANDQAKLDAMIKKNAELLKKEKENNKTLKNQFEAAKLQYKRIETSYNRESSEFLQDTAKLVRSIEDAIKEKQKVLEKKVLYKTRFNRLVFDYSQNRKFTAYANILEVAARLDPTNPNILYQLGEEYRTSQQRDRAINAYELSLESNKKAGALLKLKDDQVSNSHRSLGALYHASKNYVRALYHYEQSYTLEKDAIAKRNLLYELGKLHTEKSGNYARANELLSQLKVFLSTKNPSDLEERGQLLRTQIRVDFYMSIAHQKNSRFNEMRQLLEQSMGKHQTLETMITDQNTKIRTLHKELQEVKKTLLKQTRNRGLILYSQKEDALDKAKNTLRFLNAIRNSLPLRSIYFNLAGRYEQKHDILKAVETYTKAERLGIAADEARRHAQRLRRKL